MTIHRPGLRILLVHGDIYGFGGAEHVALRMMHVLQKHFSDITLIHAGGVLDVERIENRVGLRLNPARISFQSTQVPGWLPSSLGAWSLLKYAAALRSARRVAKGYDLVISTYGECTIDHNRVLQYIHYPLFFHDGESLGHLGVLPMRGAGHTLRRLYVETGRLVAGWNAQRITKHVTVVNSRWTGEQFCRHYGDSEYRVVYPGAEIGHRHAALPAFAGRDNDFVMLGRIVPGKRIETGIEIVRRLREECGHDVGLDIVGNAPQSYSSVMRRLVDGKHWVRWHGGLSRDGMERLIATKKWGLHANPFEHYGIAPAELQQLGCVVFVPDSGGQREIVDNPDYRYRDVPDAVAKIDRVLRTPGLPETRLGEIAQSNLRHRVSAFDDAFLALVEGVLRK